MTELSDSVIICFPTPDDSITELQTLDMQAFFEVAITELQDRYIKVLEPAS